MGDCVVIAALLLFRFRLVDIYAGRMFSSRRGPATPAHEGAAAVDRGDATPTEPPHGAVGVATTERGA